MAHVWIGDGVRRQSEWKRRYAHGDGEEVENGVVNGPRANFPSDTRRGVGCGGR